MHRMWHGGTRQTPLCVGVRRTPHRGACPVPKDGSGRMAAMDAWTGPTAGNWVRRIIFGAVLALVAVIGGTAFRVWQVARENDRTPADAIVVLGAAQYNGKPSEIFTARLEKARQLYTEGVAKTVITAGGKK